MRTGPHYCGWGVKAGMARGWWQVKLWTLVSPRDHLSTREPRVISERFRGYMLLRLSIIQTYVYFLVRPYVRSNNKIGVLYVFNREKYNTYNTYGRTMVYFTFLWITYTQDVVSQTLYCLHEHSIFRFFWLYFFVSRYFVSRCSHVSEIDCFSVLQRE